jgi:hypothetical protein
MLQHCLNLRLTLLIGFQRIVNTFWGLTNDGSLQHYILINHSLRNSKIASSIKEESSNEENDFPIRENIGQGTIHYERGNRLRNT